MKCYGLKDLTGLEKFTSTRLIYFTCAPDRAGKKTGVQNQSQSARLIENHLEKFIFVLCYLNSSCCFHFYYILPNVFCNGAFTMYYYFCFLI